MVVLLELMKGIDNAAETLQTCLTQLTPAPHLRSGIKLPILFASSCTLKLQKCP